MKDLPQFKTPIRAIAHATDRLQAAMINFPDDDDALVEILHEACWHAVQVLSNSIDALQQAGLHFGLEAGERESDPNRNPFRTAFEQMTPASIEARRELERLGVNRAAVTD
jgi:hypothetical protein